VNDNLHQLVGRFADLHVLVVGEAMLDRYLEGSSDRLCPEAPAPVVRLGGCHDVPGGAGNTAANARALGARVSLLSVVGDDADADSLCRALQARGVVDSHLVRQRGRATLAKDRVVVGSHVLVRLDRGDTAAADEAAEAAAIERLHKLFASCDAVVLSDYGYGVLTPRVVRALAALQARSPRVLVADSKSLTAYRDLGMTAVKPNYQEALRLLGEGGNGDGRDRAALLAARAERLLERTGAQVVAVTLDVEGAVVLEQGRPPYRTYARPNPQSRAVGAGDTYAAALALALAARADTPAAAELAAAAAAVVVAKDGTACCSAAELRAAVAGPDKVWPDLAALLPRLAEHRRRGHRVVLTNGCFDILHRGHVTCLSQAKALGDVLVVGVNSDASIRRLKGLHRPVNPLEDRLQVLAGLGSVDYLVPFDDDTPHALVRAIRPEVFVKGGDYGRDRLPEAALVEELGGVVRILPFVDQRSTTNLIERIRAAALHGPPASNGRARKTATP
jgi:D-beta-D-heptose 7-phosphate kinase/D-beta-D-heptose 1-phosphate adenosyltransferase